MDENMGCNPPSYQEKKGSASCSENTALHNPKNQKNIFYKCLSVIVLWRFGVILFAAALPFLILFSP